VPAKGWNVGYTYTTTGFPTNQNDGAIDGLPAENISTGYDKIGEPISLSTSVTSALVTAVGYTELGQPAQYTFASNPYGMYLDLAYDPQTQALTDVKTTEAGQPASVATQDELTYAYSGSGVSAGAGLLTSTTDAQKAGTTVDTQCYGYDYADRLAQAWTATDACAAAPTTGNSPTVGGPQPYWQSWTYDAAGDRATQTDHDPTGNTANDTTTTYHYPAAGSATDQPHTLTNTTASGPNTVQDTASFGYDADGNTTSITAGTNGSGNQTLTYNDQDQLASDVTSSGNTTYVYDASGNLLVRRDPGTTTLFLGDAQLTQNTNSGTLSGTRYYTIGSACIAARTNSGNPQLLIPDRQGTDQLSVNTSNDALTRQAFLPFGQTRGTPPATWPGGDKGYVGGTPDPATQLENLGAREYDPATGRFLTADPEFEYTSPTQMGGYDYAGNNPATGSDPTGLHDPDADGTPGLANCEQTGNPASCGEAGVTSPAPSTGSSPSQAEATLGQIKHNLQNDAHTLRDSIAQLEHLRDLVNQQLQNIKNCSENTYDSTDCLVGHSIQDGAMDWSLLLDGLELALSTTDAVGCDAMDAEDGFSDCAPENAEVGDSASSVVNEIQKEINDPNDNINQINKSIATEQAALNTDQSELNVADALSSCSNSFLGNTNVLMAEGSTKPIDQVKVGDKITNAQPDSSTTGSDTVTAVHITYTDVDYDQLTIATSTGPQTITSTAEHLYWDATTHTWTFADNLNVGDQLDTPGNRHVTILATRHYTALQPTYNLTINTTHTYYVLAGSSAVLVHNTSCKTFGHLSPSGRMDLPNTSGIYKITMNDGTSYVGKATDIHNRFHGAFRPGGALYSLGYKASEVQNLDWIEMPGATNQELFDAENMWIQYSGGIANLANRINSPGSP
jgi:RHS repeat-associated protein